MAQNIGSDADLVQRGLGGIDEAGLEQVELSAAVHLAFDELELCYLTFGLSVRRVRRDGGADSGDIPDDAICERHDKAGACPLDPGVEIGLGLAADHKLEGRDDLARVDQQGTPSSTAATVTASLNRSWRSRAVSCSISRPPPTTSPRY